MYGRGMNVLWAMYYACSWYHCSVAIRPHFLHFAFKTLGTATRNGAMNKELMVVVCLFDACEGVCGDACAWAYCA